MSKPDRSPFDFRRVRAFAFSLGNIVLVLVSSAIAFFATCLPIGLSGMGGEGPGNIVTIAFVVGGVSAIVVGAFVAYLLRRSRRDQGARDGKGEKP